MSATLFENSMPNTLWQFSWHDLGKTDNERFLFSPSLSSRPRWASSSTWPCPWRWSARAARGGRARWGTHGTRVRTARGQVGQKICLHGLYVSNIFCHCMTGTRAKRNYSNMCFDFMLSLNFCFSRLIGGGEISFRCSPNRFSDSQKQPLCVCTYIFPSIWEFATHVSTLKITEGQKVQDTSIRKK